ncbi:MAG: hypothetical protein GAK31_03125 [Stenotrophomonas maltophilia]|uniref:Uncharacterized protein n=1 Tax=Stenotrophomonas maltophilia TaxID=40324 RepID=A0A7V8JKX5_STEMA|nr:MAG: hypothetical protein GAK31_03125 [Stenotrophomonas maltophilia]
MPYPSSVSEDKAPSVAIPRCFRWVWLFWPIC